MGHSLTITYVSSHLNTTPRMRIGEFSSRTITSAPKCKTETELPRAVWTSVRKILPTSAKADRLKIFTLNMKDCRVAEWLGLGVEALFVQSTSNEKQILCNIVGIRNPVICIGFPHPHPVSSALDGTTDRSKVLSTFVLSGYFCHAVIEKWWERINKVHTHSTPAKSFSEQE